MKYLVKFRADWSDEFECQQFVIREGSYESIAKEIKEFCSEEQYFGTNEGFYPGELSLNTDFQILPISLEEFAVLKVLFPSERFGTGPLW